MSCDARSLQPRDLAIAAGLQSIGEPRMVYANLFKGAAFPIASNDGLVSVYGGWDWLPSGSAEDPELRRHFNARDDAKFKARAKVLTQSSVDTGASPWQQYKFLEMRKGDIVVVRNSDSTKQPHKLPTKFLIGVWNKDFDEAGGAVWRSMESLGVHQTDMAASSDADCASRTRLWRPVTWVREGDWKKGQLDPSTFIKLAGIQAATIQEFKEESKAAFLDMLHHSRPFQPSPATTHNGKKRKADAHATIDLQDDDEAEPPANKKPTPAGSSSTSLAPTLMDKVKDLATQLNLSHLLPAIPSVLKEAERIMEVTPPPGIGLTARTDTLLKQM